MTDYIIRSLEKTDYYSNYLSLLEQLTVVDRELITYERFSNQFDKLVNKVYLLLIDGKIVATGSVFIEYKFIRNLGSVAHIEDVVVDKNYRKLGLGKILIEYLIDVAKTNSCYKVILDCSKDNISFYERCGFTHKEYEMVKYLN